MLEVRFHGRGGQGAVMASRILANAVVRTGGYGASFPMFGFERRGAPVTAFGRFSDKKVREKTQIYHPDVLVVLDPSQSFSEAVYQGLVADGLMVLNAETSFKEKPDDHLKKAGIIDADSIAMEEIGMAMPNTAVVGAFAKVTGLVGIEPVLGSLEDYFKGEKLTANIRCAKRGYDEVVIQDF